MIQQAMGLLVGSSFETPVSGLFEARGSFGSL
jgi:hypothetical protein